MTRQENAVWLSQNPTRKLNYFGLIILSICLAGKPGARREACKLNSQNETQTYWERKVWRVQNERKYPTGINEANFMYTYIYLYIEPIYLVRIKPFLREGKTSLQLFFNIYYIMHLTRLSRSTSWLLIYLQRNRHSMDGKSMFCITMSLHSLYEVTNNFPAKHDFLTKIVFTILGKEQE